MPVQPPRLPIAMVALPKRRIAALMSSMDDVGSSDLSMPTPICATRAEALNVTSRNFESVGNIISTKACVAESASRTHRHTPTPQYTCV